MVHVFHNPVRCVFGDGALATLDAEIGDRRAVLITFPEARGLGLVGRVEALLGRRLAGVIDRVTPNPDVAELGPAHGELWQAHADAEVLVALGGGSAIDTAKALMVDAEGGFDALVAALESGATPAPTRCKTLIAIPTTAGTGSEVTPWATIWDRRGQRKHSLHTPYTWPGVAIVDPVLMRTLPPAVTLQSGLDALSHALEALWNRHANPVSDTLAVAAAREVIDTLPRLMERPDHGPWRSAMAMAALKAGLAFSNTRTALAHSISYALTLQRGVPHGIACSFSLPMVLDLARGRSAERDRVLAEALGPLDGAAARLESFLHALGVRTRFVDYGIDEAEAGSLVADALKGARGLNFIGTTEVAQ
jgi:phosphonate metabolism-associated iron-containing alcohol dehydrogenase